MEYIEIPAKIPLKLGSDLHQRLSKLAEKDDSTLATELSFAVLYGIYQHIRQNLDLIEKRKSSAFGRRHGRQVLSASTPAAAGGRPNAIRKGGYQMPDDIVTLMVVDTPDGRLLAEGPLVRRAEAGMTAFIGDIRGVISLITLTHRGSVEYEMAKALAGRVYRVTGIILPWDTPEAK